MPRQCFSNRAARGPTQEWSDGAIHALRLGDPLSFDPLKLSRSSINTPYSPSTCLKGGCSSGREISVLKGSWPLLVRACAVLGNRDTCIPRTHILRIPHLLGGVRLTWFTRAALLLIHWATILRILSVYTVVAIGIANLGTPQTTSAACWPRVGSSKP